MDVCDYKRKLELNKLNNLTENQKIIKKNTPYIIKQIHKKIKKNLCEGKETICLNSIYTLKAREKYFSNRVRFKDLKNEWKKRVLPVIEKEMKRLGYTKEDGVTWSVYSKEEYCG